MVRTIIFFTLIRIELQIYICTINKADTEFLLRVGGFKFVELDERPIFLDFLFIYFFWENHHNSCFQSRQYNESMTIYYV
jgi:hypothetical protein